MSGGVALALCLGLGATSCATRPYRYTPLESVDFRGRAQTERAGRLRVTVAVPDAAESKALLGIPVYDRGIQPVWIEVENGSAKRVRFAPVGVDRDYFAPLEVAYLHRSLFSKQGHRDMERRFHEIAMPRQIWPGETRSGIVFTHLSPGTKSFNVDLFSAGGEDHSFTFFVDVPGFRPDHAQVDFAGLYAPDQVRDLDLPGFRAALGELSCCATDRTGTRPGLPINVVLVGEGEEALQALLRAGWYERTRAVDPSVIEGEQNWRGRPPDAVFRIRRAKVGDRNELRVWLAPLRVEGKPVWLGQITHYIGRPTELGRALLEPRLDPNLDDSRNFMLQVIWYAQGLARFAWQNTGEAVPITESRYEFRDVGYFTDGHRIVLWLSGPPVSLLESQRLDWDAPPRPREASR